MDCEREWMLRMNPRVAEIRRSEESDKTKA